MKRVRHEQEAREARLRLDLTDALGPNHGPVVADAIRAYVKDTLEAKLDNGVNADVSRVADEGNKDLQALREELTSADRLEDRVFIEKVETIARGVIAEETLDGGEIISAIDDAIADTVTDIDNAIADADINTIMVTDAAIDVATVELIESNDLAEKIRSIVGDVIEEELTDGMIDSRIAMLIAEDKSS